jgi:hypothetical protein
LSKLSIPPLPHATFQSVTRQIGKPFPIFRNNGICFCGQKASTVHLFSECITLSRRGNSHSVKEGLMILLGLQLGRERFEGQLVCIVRKGAKRRKGEKIGLKALLLASLIKDISDHLS